MKTIDLKNLRITVEHFVSLPLTVTDYICEVVDKLGSAGAYIKPGIVDTDEQERDCHQFFLKYYRQLGNDLEEERIYYPFVTNINDIDIINMIVKYFYDDNYAAEILHFANDEIRDSSDVIVIVDNIGWFDNVTKTEKSIKKFYDKTGVQPYIVLNAYDSTLLTDTAKEEYAKKWYDEHIKNESTFLYMYFAEPDTDNDVGYMAYVNGKQVSSVMDSEAIEIFWAYVDKYWYSDMSTDDMFTTIFTKTADRIMTKSTTAADVGNNAVKVIGVIVVFAGIIVVMVLRRKHKAEEAKETEKILNTPLNGDSEADDLLKKYKKGD